MRKDDCTMNCTVIGKSVQGASHIVHNTECQDSYRQIQFDDGCAIVAVADGHGSSSCPFSKSGSTIAVNTLIHIISELHDLYADKLDALSTYLNREGEVKIAQTIDLEWKKRVLKAHSNAKREFPLDEDGNRNKEAIYKMYGSTLLGAFITPEFVFAFQLGDGDIMFVNDTYCEPVIEGDKILGVETHSLSKNLAWKTCITTIRRIDNSMFPCLFMLSTDGLSNSYINDAEFKKTCTDYYNLIKEYGTTRISKQLKDWLSDTSREGCGDDITAVFAYLT